jgi:hypothetical protein
LTADSRKRLLVVDRISIISQIGEQKSVVFGRKDEEERLSTPLRGALPLLSRKTP